MVEAASSADVRKFVFSSVIHPSISKLICGSGVLFTKETKDESDHRRINTHFRGFQINDVLVPSLNLDESYVQYQSLQT